MLLTRLEASDGPRDNTVVKFGASCHFEVHFRGQGAGDNHVVEFNTGEVFNFEFQSQGTGVFTNGDGHGTFLRTSWVGVEALAQRHHLLSVDLVSHGVILGGFQLVNRNMLATDVG